jgi:CubicO group peptidase (beta-lactamase class C family)
MNRSVVLLAVAVLCCGTTTAAPAATLRVKGTAFLLDGRSLDMWGVRTASASQSQELTDRLIAQLDDYAAHGVNSLSVFYMGSSGVYADPFNADGTAVDPAHQRRIEQIIQACDRRGMIVIVGIFYQRCNQPSLRDWAAATEAVRTVARLLKPYRNVIVNIANEQNSTRYQALPWSRVRNVEDLVQLCRVVKTVDPERIVGAGGYDHASNERLGQSPEVDVLLFDTTGSTRSGPVFERYRAAGVRDKPMVNVETFGAWTNQFLPPGVFSAEVKRAYLAEIEDAARHPGLYVHLHNTPWFQAFTPGDKIRYDLGGQGTAEDPGLRWYFEAVKKARADIAYFPPPDIEGGWRKAITPDDARRLAGLDTARLDEAFEVAQASTKNGGLLVVRHGYLAYERYFGLGHREATPNLASCGKSFTSVAVGILMHQRPDLFPAGLDQKVFTPAYMPPEVFPLSDPRKAEIKLGQLLAFTAGIRGNNPSRTGGQEVTLDPPGPDGAAAMIDSVAAGRRGIDFQGRSTSAATLWCTPGEGYSYATASAHLASMMVRHVSGMELEAYVRDRLARPLGWGNFTYGYRSAEEITHTPGGGGIAVRATDMLRFGYLLLREGRWGDRQVVPAEFVRHCGTASPYNPHSPYSLQFDVNTDGQWTGVPRDAFWKSGSGAHMLYVVPTLDLVVWKLAGRDGQYQERDTGVPLDPAIVAAAQSRSDWKPSLNEREGQREVLRKVVAAVQRSE